MSGAVFRAMLLGLLRDRAALLMSFLLPVVFFLIFASIFSGASGEQIRLGVAFADEVHSETSGRLLRALLREPAVRPVAGAALTGDEVRALVRRGTADVGLIVRAGGESLESFGGFGLAPIVIVSDPARGVAVPLLSGLVQKAYFGALPDVALRSVMDLIEQEMVTLTEDQRASLDAGLADLREESITAEGTGVVVGWSAQDLFERENVTGQSAALNHVAYYAGAVAVLFLLFSCVHGALTLLEEKESGLMERVLSGPAGSSVLVDGRFLFLLVQGFVQMSVLFAVAWAVFGVDVPGHLFPWALATLATAAAASGLALAIVTPCRTKRQAQTFANIAILVLSALGGSMVPRFFMPPFLQKLGWVTPNTWALEAYTSIFWRDEPISSLAWPCLALVATAAVGLWLSRRWARRWECV